MILTPTFSMYRAKKLLRSWFWHKCHKAHRNGVFLNRNTCCKWRAGRPPIGGGRARSPSKLCAGAVSAPQPKRFQMSVNALRRAGSMSSKTLGVKLLTHAIVDGIRITPEGERVFAAASQMEAASFGLQARAESDNDNITGEVRLAVTEGLGTAWIAPRLVEFQRANPNLIIDLNCAMKSADVLRLEADVAIQITRPTAPDLRLVKRPSPPHSVRGAELS